MKHSSIILLFFFLINCENNKSDTPLLDIECTNRLDNSEILLSDSDSINFRYIKNLIVSENKLYFTIYFDGIIYTYDLNNKRMGQLNEAGKGPNEFMNPFLRKKDNFIYAFDPPNQKVSKFSIMDSSFIQESFFETFINGDIEYVEHKGLEEAYYFSTIKRDRINNSTIKSIIKYDESFTSIDTVYTFRDGSRVSLWDPKTKSDYSFDGRMYSHNQLGIVDDQLVVANTNQFSFMDLNENDLFSFEYKYTPNYTSYINSSLEQIENESRNPEKESKVFLTALDENDKPFDAKFIEWLSNDKFLLYSLFSPGSSYLLYDMGNNQTKTICTDLQVRPLYITENWLYMVDLTDINKTELIRTEINSLNYD